MDVSAVYRRFGPEIINSCRMKKERKWSTTSSSAISIKDHEGIVSELQSADEW